MKRHSGSPGRLYGCSYSPYGEAKEQRKGHLVGPRTRVPDHLAGALLQLASSPALRHQLGAAAVLAAHGRSWERALGQLGAGYRRALEREPAPLAQVA